MCGIATMNTEIDTITHTNPHKPERGLRGVAGACSRTTQTDHTTNGEGA